MNTEKLEILHLEDSPVDHQLMIATLEDQGLACAVRWAATATAFRAALEAGPFNVIVSDFGLPGYDGISALKEARERYPDTPFVFLSGTIGEERAIEAVRSGATDYVLKDRMQRLPDVLRRARAEALNQAERRRAELELQQRLVQQAAVAELGQRALSGGDPGALMQQAAEAVGGVYRGAFVAVLTLDDAGRTLLLSGHHGWKAAPQGRVEVPVEPGLFTTGVLESADPVAVLDLRSDPRFRALPFAPDLQAGMGVRLALPDRPLGVLLAHLPAPYRFEAHDAHFLSSVANTLGTAAARARAEHDLAASREQLLQSQKLEAVGRLAGGVAHDFNNVLGVIVGYADLLLADMPADDPDREAIQTMKEAAERAAGLTRQLLAFSRRQVLNMRVMDLRATVLELDRMLQRLIGEDVRLALDLPPAVGRIQADPGQMEQVIMNLVVNARDAMPRGGAISIRLSDVVREAGELKAHPRAQPGPFVCLTVSDSGEGIPPEVVSRIFEPFFTTKPRDRGTGLGLSTVLGIVEQSGGHIEVDTQVDRGTSFRLYLPRVDAPLEPARQAAVPRPAAAARTVLLVEDQADVRRLTARLLERAGYTVLQAADAVAAHALAAERGRDIHVLISDVVMPGQSGVELARALSEQHPHLRVLLVSGYTDEAIAHHGATASPFPLLEKPFTQATLTAKVAEVLGGS